MHVLDCLSQHFAIRIFIIQRVIFNSFGLNLTTLKLNRGLEGLNTLQSVFFCLEYDYIEVYIYI